MNTSQKRRLADIDDDNYEPKLKKNNNVKGSLADIDEMVDNYIPNKNEENFSIIYFVILSHGVIPYKSVDDDDDESNVSPIITTIPATIEYFNKITYAPLGFPNILINSERESGILYNNQYIFNQIKNKLSSEYLVNYGLIKVLPEVEELSKMLLPLGGKRTRRRYTRRFVRGTRKSH